MKSYRVTVKQTFTRIGTVTVNADSDMDAMDHAEYLDDSLIEWKDLTCETMDAVDAEEEGTR